MEGRTDPYYRKASLLTRDIQSEDKTLKNQKTLGGGGGRRIQQG